MTTVLRYGTNKIPVKKSAEYQREHRERRKKKDPEYLKKEASYQREYRARIRQEVLAAYGGKCSCCGETEPLFLTLDHVNNDGTKHRRDVGGTSAAVFNDIKRRGFPPNYRVQCFNCNLGRARCGGICPHEKKNKLSV